MLGVDEGRDPAQPLRLGDDVERERRLARRLRAVDLGHAPARQAADAEGGVERQRAGRDDGDLLERPARAQPHDGALAELSLDLRDRQLEGLPPIVLALSHAGAPCVVRVSGPGGVDRGNGYARPHSRCARGKPSMSGNADGPHSSRRAV